MIRMTTFEAFFGIQLPLEERTYENTPKRMYNCGGYALENYGWYCPYSEDDAIYMDDVFEFCEVKYEEEKFVEYMLDTIPNLRSITDISELAENEYAIAFRVSCDDFHFVKRGGNGCWYEKMGGSNCINRMTKEEVFSDRWHDRYDGELYLFAKKR